MYSLLRKVSIDSDNLKLSLNCFKCVETVFRVGLSSHLPLSSLSLDSIEMLSMF